MERTKLFQSVQEAEQYDFFRIIEENGVKKIILAGNVYYTESEGLAEDGAVRPDFTYRILEYSGAEFPLDEFIASEDVASLVEGKKQYLTDTNEEGALYAAEHWFGVDIQVIKCDKITADLPCGYYCVIFM